MKEKRTLAWAEIVKTKTDDGMFEVDAKFLNSRFQVILESRRQGVIYNVEHRKHTSRQVINKVEGGWLPVELLRIEV